MPSYDDVMIIEFPKKKKPGLVNFTHHDLF